MFFSLQIDFSRGLCCSTQNQHEAKPRIVHQSIGQFLPGQPASLIIESAVVRLLKLARAQARASEECPECLQVLDLMVEETRQNQTLIGRTIIKG